MSKFFIQGETTRISFDDGEWVDIKQEFSQADHDYITAQMMSATVAGQSQPEVKMNFGKQATLERAIVAWSFADEGKPVAVAPETISNLRTKYRMRVLAEIDRLAREAGEFSKN